MTAHDALEQEGFELLAAFPARHGCAVLLFRRTPPADPWAFDEPDDQVFDEADRLAGMGLTPTQIRALGFEPKETS